MSENGTRGVDGSAVRRRVRRADAITGDPTTIVRPAVVLNGGEKVPFYQDMRDTSQPLLTAICIGLVRDSQKRYRITDPDTIQISNISSPIRDKDIPMIDLLCADLRASGIPLTSDSRFKSNNKIFFRVAPDRTSDGPLLLTARSADQQELFQAGVECIEDALERILPSDVDFFAVHREYRQRHSKLDERYMLKKGLYAAVDGIFSTYIAATWLSQQEIEGREDLGDKDRLLAVLESETAIVDLTGAVKANTLAQLATFNTIPQNQLRPTEDGDDFELHPDVLAYLPYINELLAKFSAQLPKPMVCPFSTPLGVARTQRVIDLYDASLPDDVTQTLLDTTRVSAITMTARAIATNIRANL